MQNWQGFFQATVKYRDGTIISNTNIEFPIPPNISSQSIKIVLCVKNFIAKIKPPWKFSTIVLYALLGADTAACPGNWILLAFAASY